MADPTGKPLRAWPHVVLGVVLVVLLVVAALLTSGTSPPPSAKQLAEQDAAAMAPADLKRAYDEPETQVTFHAVPGFALSAGSPNGQIPASQLCPITGGVTGSIPGEGELACGGAAASWNAMAVYVHARSGFWLQSNGSWSAYRPLAAQQYLYTHCPAVCAYPGTSLHGWGQAVDNSTSSQAAIRAVGAKFDWAILGGGGPCATDAPSENWHARYCGGYTGSDPGPYGTSGPKPFNVLKRGDGGPRARALNCRYRNLHRSRSATGRGPYDRHKSSHYGRGMVRATERFQRDSKLDVDGVYGQQSNRRMTRRWAGYKKHHPNPHCGPIGR